mmetsp:Transcript_14315/g.50251  ORF Transcript_14315/g.50251 Transcript_14315/m.50251 type:complete len:258 (-) Transcript_14315:613-1386(-)
MLERATPASTTRLGHDYMIAQMRNDKHIIVLTCVPLSPEWRPLGRLRHALFSVGLGCQYVDIVEGAARAVTHGSVRNGLQAGCASLRVGARAARRLAHAGHGGSQGSELGFEHHALDGNLAANCVGVCDHRLRGALRAQARERVPETSADAACWNASAAGRGRGVSACRGCCVRPKKFWLRAVPHERTWMGGRAVRSRGRHRAHLRRQAARLLAGLRTEGLPLLRRPGRHRRVRGEAVGVDIRGVAHDGLQRPWLSG